MNEEKAMIVQYESETVQQKETNARHIQENIDLQDQTEALERHIRMLYEQNNTLESEVDRLIREDDELANKLERRSQSPAKIRANYSMHHIDTIEVKRETKTQPQQHLQPRLTDEVKE